MVGARLCMGGEWGRRGLPMHCSQDEDCLNYEHRSRLLND